MNWTCNDTRRAMLRQLDLPDEALSHLASCELCQKISDIATVSGDLNTEPPLDVEKLLNSTRNELDQEHGIAAWLRSRPLRLQLTLGLVAALVPVGYQLVFARRGDMAEFPLARLLAFAIAYGVSIVVAATALLSPLYRTRSPAKDWIAAAFVLTIPFLFVVTNPETPSTVSANPLNYLRAAYSCLRYGVLLAIPSVILLLTMKRALTRRWRIGLVAAALGGAVGNFVLLLHCSNPETLHQLLGHASVGVALLVLIGAVGVLTKRRPIR